MGFPKIGFAKRLLALYGITFVLVLLVTDWTLSQVLQKRDLQNLQSALLGQATLIRAAATPLLTEKDLLQSQIKELAQGTDLRITLVDRKGAVLADSSESEEELDTMDNHATRPEIAAAFRKETGISTRYSMTLKTKMLYVAIPIFEKEKILGAVRTALPVTRIDAILGSIRGPVALTVLFAILIVLTAGIFFNRQLSKRIRCISSGAERYAREDWSEKILMNGQDELTMLAATMNQMAASLHTRIEDLESEKSKIAAILTHMKDGVIAIDRRKTCLMINPAATQTFETGVMPISGKSLIEITRHPQLEMLVDRAFLEKKNLGGDIETSGRSRRIIHVTVLIPDTSIRDLGGILVFHDMTELRRLENTRKEFVSNVSHELRTPLTSIKGFIETLLHGASKDPVLSEKFLRIMDEETSRLGRLVEDILTLGEIEQGTSLLKKEKIDLASLIPAILEHFKPRAKEHQLTIENPLESPLVISGDKDKVRQIFMNLIDNAIKFSKPGGRIAFRAEAGTKGITVFVEDTGIGISEEAQGRIFERFFREDKTRSKELGGTGLGLAIVKHIMEAHGGHASCQSRPGQGSTFSVFFPS